MSETRHCRKARQRAIPFDCKLNAGHEGKCTPYTLKPLTAGEWARLRNGTMPDQIPRAELAALNPGMDERGLARLAAFEQLLTEDDEASGYEDPEDECEGAP